MAKHKYTIEAKNGKLYCYEDGAEVQDWEFLKGERMPEMKLFVNGAGVATRKEIEWVGLTDKEYNNLRNGVEVPYYGVLKTERTVDTETGEITCKAWTEAGLTITVLDKDCRLIKEKCRVIKAEEMSKAAE